jgi:hypothetical protein
MSHLTLTSASPPSSRSLSKLTFHIPNVLWLRRLDLTRYELIQRSLRPIRRTLHLLLRRPLHGRILDIRPHVHRHQILELRLDKSTISVSLSGYIPVTLSAREEREGRRRDEPMAS